MTLTATLRNSQFCSCVEGLTDTATWNPATQSWQWQFTSAANCGTDTGDEIMVVDIELECRQIDEVTCEWWINYETTCDSGGFSGSVPLTEESITCDPFYGESGTILDVLCCNATSPDQGLFYVEIQEP